MMNLRQNSHHDLNSVQSDCEESDRTNNDDDHCGNGKIGLNIPSFDMTPLPEIRPDEDLNDNNGMNNAPSSHAWGFGSVKILLTYLLAFGATVFSFQNQLTGGISNIRLENMNDEPETEPEETPTSPPENARRSRRFKLFSKIRKLFTRNDCRRSCRKRPIRRNYAPEDQESRSRINNLKRPESSQRSSGDGEEGRKPRRRRSSRFWNMCTRGTQDNCELEPYTKREEKSNLVVEDLVTVINDDEHEQQTLVLVEPVRERDQVSGSADESVPAPSQPTACTESDGLYRQYFSSEFDLHTTEVSSENISKRLNSDNDSKNSKVGSDDGYASGDSANGDKSDVTDEESSIQDTCDGSDDGSDFSQGVVEDADVNDMPQTASECLTEDIFFEMAANGNEGETKYGDWCFASYKHHGKRKGIFATSDRNEYQYSDGKSLHTNMSPSLTYPSLPGTYQSLSGNYQSLPGEPTPSQSFREPISHQLSSLTLRDSGYDVTTTRSDVTKDESGLAPLPEPDYRRERDRLASFWQAPRKAEVDPIICAREGLWCTGWQDCAACFQCPFRHWDWRLGQDPKKLHLDNSPNCPVAKGESDVNEPFEPSMLTLSRDGKDKVTACMQALLPKQMELEQYNEDAEKRRDEEKKMLTRAAIEDSVAVNYRLSKAPLGESTYEIPETPNPPLPDPIPGAPTKIIYYALEHSREGQPRCVPHIVDPKATVAQKSGVPDELRNEKHRLDSFRKWPGTPPFIVYDYARNGFFYTGTNRDIKCAFCGGVLAVPGILRRFSITAKHKRAFPTCPLVLKLEVGNVQLPVDEKLKLPTQNTETHTLRQPDWTGIEQAILTIKFPQFADRNNRALSFMGWSPDFNQKSDLLVECGFFCLGDGDSVRCFHCGGGLRNWEPTDDPWREHARWFPRCMYLQQKKGLDYVRRVRDESNVTDWVATAGGSGASGSGSQSSGGRKRRLNLTQGAIPSPIPNTPRFPNGVTEPSVMSRGVQWRFQPREIRARMDTTGVRRLMDMGYSPVVIRFCIVTQLRDTGKDFQRLDELTEAVLDLEPVVEEHGEHFLEVILKNKYDLDHLPALLKESYYQTVDETYVPELRITPPSTRPDVSTTRPDVTATRDVTSTTRTNGSGSATTTTSSAAPQTLTTTDGGDRRQAQAQRLESNIARVAAAGSSAPSQPPAPQTEPEPPSQGRRGRKSRKKSSDPRGSDTATPSTSSAATHDDPGSASSSLSAASELAEENARLREQNLCKICLDRPINIAFIPCGHLAVCFECGRTLTECPICRKNIRKRQRIFLS